MMKPCPFCGGQTSFEGWNYVCGFQFRCDGCDAVLSLRAPQKTYAKKTTEEIEEVAAEVWNTRSYPPEVQKAIERMKPKKVVCRHFNKYYGNEIGDCPNCLCTIEDESELNEHPHCKYCGQALDWSE